MPGADDGLMVKGLGPMIQLQLEANAANELLTKSEKDLADAAKIAADAINAQNQAFHDLLATEMAALNADLAYEQAIDDLTESVDDNGTSLNIHSQKGRDNEKAILSVVSALAAQRDAEVAAGTGIDVANAHFQSQIGVLRNHLVQLGFSKGAVDALINSVKAIPPRAGTSVTASVSEAITRINSVANRLAALDGDTATTYVNTVFTHVTSRLASGTSSAPPGLAWVGERGPELMTMRGGERVYPHEQSVRMQHAYAGAPGYAGGVGTGLAARTAPINVYGGGLGEAVMAYLRSEVAKQGGDVQAVIGRG
jgi:phage-related tail protein